ncbi:MAG: FAD:protein FMN transferase [Simkaniaceae bacterium]
MPKWRPLLFLSRVLFLLFLFSCAPSFKINHFRGVAMTMPYHIQLGKLHHSSKQIEAKITEVFEKVNHCYNHFNPNSELSKLNQAESGVLSNALYELFLLSDQIYKMTNGVFDPSFGHWKEFVFRGNTIEKGSLTLDFDGIVKGLTVDLLASMLSDLGYRNFYVEWAGDLFVKGNHFNGRPWRIAVKKPYSDIPFQIIELKDRAVATSGNYFHQKIVENALLTHFFDPKKQIFLPVTKEIQSVTVIGPSCALADALATALFVDLKKIDLPMEVDLIIQ